MFHKQFARKKNENIRPRIPTHISNSSQNYTNHFQINAKKNWIHPQSKHSHRHPKASSSRNTHTHTPYIYVKHFCNGGARGGTLIVTPDHAEFQFIAQVYHKLWLLRQHRSLRPFLRPRSKSELPLLSISADVRVWGKSLYAKLSSIRIFD